MSISDNLAKAAFIKSVSYGEYRYLQRLNLENISNKLTCSMSSYAITLQGDSTGNEVTEWFYRVMQSLAIKYPGYTFLHRLWSDDHQNYSGNISVIQTGSSGDGYLTLLNGYIQNNGVDESIVNSDLEIVVKVAADDWTPASSTGIIISKFGLAGNRAWALGISSSGKLWLWYSVDGTTLLGGGGSSAESSIAPTVADGEPLWIKCTLDLDNGSSQHVIKYYTSIDNITYVQLGTDRVISGEISSLYNSTANILVGNRVGSTGYFNGKFYKAYVRKGINGKIVASPDAAMGYIINKSANYSTFKDAENNIWSKTSGVTFGGGSPMILILNASHPGALLSYSSDLSRFNLQTPLESILNFISYSHNEGYKVDYENEYESFINQILTKYTNSFPICIAQNPQKNSDSNEYEHPYHHGVRCAIITALAIKKGWGIIDVYNAFIKTGIQDDLINADGVHPTAIGFDLWVNVAKNFLFNLTM